jgi:hypothetical protein
MNRRQFLASTAAVVGGLSAANSTAAAADPYAEQPDHVTLAYPESRLQDYQPLLVTSHLDIPPDYLYAWEASSPERDTDVLCYWAWYTAGQRGVAGQADSHVPDREGLYVFVSEDGSVEKVVMDGYHYLAATVPGDTLTYSDSTQPRIHVIEPWHNYRTTTTPGEDVELRDLRDIYPAWLDNGWEVDREAVVDPWTIQTKGDWWPRGTFGVNANATLAKTSRSVRDATGVDPARYIGRLIGT